MREYAGWANGYVAETCVASDGSEAPKVLGVRIGDGGVVTRDFERILGKMAAAREAVWELDDAPCEFLLHTGAST